MISINGMCYDSETDSDQTTYAVIGDITIGQCYDILQGNSKTFIAPTYLAIAASLCKISILMYSTHAR